MQLISKQKGLTAISWMFIVAAGALLLIFLLRLVPIYLEGFSVSETVRNMADEKALIKSPVRDIKRTILKRLNVSSVYSVTGDDIYVTKGRNNVTIEIDYEVREKVMGNLDFVVSFNKEVTIQ